MVVRLKFNDTERTAQVKLQDTIGYIKRTYFAGQEQQVRLIYQGQLLQDDAQTLASLNLVHNCVLHCHISQHASRGAAGGPRPVDQVQVALNRGTLMYLLLVLMLSVLWHLYLVAFGVSQHASRGAEVGPRPVDQVHVALNMVFLLLLLMLSVLVHLSLEAFVVYRH